VITEAVVRRVRKQGLKGLEASTIGLTLVGYIAAGFLIGQWLDGHFKTGFWMPLLVMVGTAAGFRDILKLVTRMAERAKTESEDRAVVRKTVASQMTGTETTKAEATEDRPKPRLFAVPPPPKPSFDRSGEDTSTKSITQPAAINDDAATDDATLIEKLLAEDAQDERPENNKEKDSETI
jgi:F0F1-type ATP synthase assembly protein I